MRITVIIITLLLLNTGLSAQVVQEWIVPAERKARLSPFEFTQQNRESGSVIFKANCLSCHGMPGQNNWLRDLNPQPGDPASEKYQKNTDGELFHKLTEGRGLMPGFRNVLTQTDLWNIVSYIRSFNPAYKQVVAPPRRSDAPDYSYISIKLTKTEPAGTVTVQATGYINDQPSAVSGAEVQISAARNFGRLVLGDPVTTNELGIATFLVPGTIKGDSLGNILITARLTEEDLYGIASADTLLKLGEPVVPTSLTEKRAMWNTVRKAPIWLIITFTLSVFTVWGFIFYVLLHIRDLWILGKMESSKD